MVEAHAQEQADAGVEHEVADVQPPALAVGLVLGVAQEPRLGVGEERARVRRVAGGEAGPELARVADDVERGDEQRDDADGVRERARVPVDALVLRHPEEGREVGDRADAEGDAPAPRPELRPVGAAAELGVDPMQAQLGIERAHPRIGRAEGGDGRARGGAGARRGEEQQRRERQQRGDRVGEARPPLSARAAGRCGSGRRRRRRGTPGW